MTTTPNEPVEDPDVVPSGAPERPGTGPDPDTEPDPGAPPPEPEVRPV
jgi:hypothetical protein